MIMLRPQCAADANALFGLLAGVAETLVVDGPSTAGELEAALGEREELQAAGLVKAYVILADGVVMGSIRLVYQRGSGEIGVWLGREFQRRGYGSEAIRRVMEEGFEDLRLGRIEARIFEGNAASRKAFENNGFVIERVERNGVMQRGKFRDVWVMAARCARSRLEGEGHEV